MKATLTHYITAAVCLFSAPLMAVRVVVTATPSGCGGCSGTLIANASGGIPPYTYFWSPAPPSGQGTPNLQGPCAGEWTVEVTDGLGNTDQATGTVLATTQLNFPNAVEIRSGCQSSCPGWATI